MSGEPGFDPPAPEQPGEVLLRPGDAEASAPGEMRAAISNAMVALKKQFYGRGPERARTYIDDIYVFCVLEGGLTRNEMTLLDAGEARLVFEYRQKFQWAMRKATQEAVAKVTGREVVSYQSTMVFDPPRSFEIFVLDAPV